MTYDPADRIETLTYPSGEKLTYEYSDRTGLPESLDTDGGDVIVSDAVYTAQGAPRSQTWGASLPDSLDIFVEWDYKADSQRLWKINADRDTSGGTDLALLRYHYDKVGNVTQLKDNKNSSQVQCFTYDGLYRLETAFTSDDDPGADDCSDGYGSLGTGSYHRSFDYDPLGNIESWTDELTSTTRDYDYGETTNAGPHAVTTYDGGTYGYDANGNQTTRPGGDTLDFDVANRLASYTSGGNTTTFTYDADGARVVRDEGATDTVYIGGIYEEAGTNEKSYYSFGGAVVAFRETDTGVDERYYLISDHLGTNSHQIRYSDSSRSSQYYYPFGDVRGTYSGGLDTDRGYTGQVSDAAQTGLLFYNARYHDPNLRRFISADTLIPDPANPQDLNRYSYVRNNPVSYSDPSGHCTLSGGAKVEDASGDPCTNRNEAYDTFVTTCTRLVIEAGLCNEPRPAQYLPADVQQGIDDTLMMYLGPCDGWCVVASIVVGMTPVGWIAEAVGCGNGDRIACAGLVAGPALRLFSRALSFLRAADEAAELATRSPAQAAADAAAAAGKPGGVAAQFEVGGQTLVDVSGSATRLHPMVQEALDSVPHPRKPWHGGCAEPRCVSQALDAGLDPSDGTMTAVQIGNSGPVPHGGVRAPCPSCEVVRDWFGYKQ